MATVTTNISNDNSTTPMIVSQGGTGAASFTQNRLMASGTSSTNPLATISGGTSGQLLVSAGTSLPAFGLSFPSWTITNASASAAIFKGYILYKASGSQTITLPAVGATTAGTMIAVQGCGGASWTVAANAADTISWIGGAVTTSGGSVASSGNFDSAVFVVSNIAAGNAWIIFSASTAGFTFS